MNMSAFIAALIFLLISIAALVFMFVGKAPFCSGKYRSFYRASCGVYISGVLLVLIFTLIMKKLPLVYVLISDITVTVPSGSDCRRVRTAATAAHPLPLTVYSILLSFFPQR